MELDVKLAHREKVDTVKTDAFYNNELITALTNEEDTFVILWDDQDEIVYVSSNVQQLTNKNNSELLGEKWMDIIPKENVENIKEHFLISNEKLTIQQLLYQFPNEVPFVFSGSIQEIILNNETLHLLKVQNVVQKHMLEESIYNSHRFLLVNQMAAGLVHEINNPLASVKGFIQLIKNGIEQHDDYYELMIAEIERIESITKQLLENVKTRNNFSFQNENVHTIIKEVTYLFDVQSKIKQIKFNVDINSSVNINCSRSLIKQVFINIIKNGIEAMKKGGTINIQSYYENNYLVLSFKDEGEGIDASKLKNLNNPNFTTKRDGTGLGLMICNKIIKQHSGKLRVSSNPSLGTNFELLLPMI